MEESEGVAKAPNQKSGKGYSEILKELNRNLKKLVEEIIDSVD